MFVPCCDVDTDNISVWPTRSQRAIFNRYLTFLLADVVPVDLVLLHVDINARLVFQQMFSIYACTYQWLICETYHTLLSTGFDCKIMYRFQTFAEYEFVIVSYLG